MSLRESSGKNSLLKNWRDERAFRISKTLSWAGLILISISTAVDLYFGMPTIVLVGDIVLVCGCGIALCFSFSEKRKLPLIWGPLYVGLWVATFTSLFSTGGIQSPFIGGYLALLFIGGLIIQSQIRIFWVMIFTLANLAFWCVMEVFYPNSFGERPPLYFNFLINGLVVAALTVYIYEFLRTESSLAVEVIKRYEELEKAQANVTREETANAAKSTFLANVSHELRTPLGAILGYAELIQDQDTDLIKRQEHAQTILRNGQQLARLVDDLLDLSKVEAGKTELESIEFQLSKMLSDVLDLLKLSAQKKGLSIKLSYRDQIPEFLISDPTRIKQILLNVVGNAVKFTERGEVIIRVFFQSENSQLRVEIQDTGQGLSLAEQSRLFRPFTQADASVTRKFGGTGLGLSLSRHLARLFGGDLQLSWSQPGVGSQFVLFVPVKVAPIRASNAIDKQNSSVVQKSSAAQILEGVQVLLVDDTIDNQKLVSLFLEKTGAKVQLASDGVEAIQKAMQTDFDLILMDVQMPVMDGLQAATILRQKNFHRPIIALTAHAMKEDRDRCIAAGFDDYLAKPVDRQLLISKVKTLISKANEASPRQAHLHTHL